MRKNLIKLLLIFVLGVLVVTSSCNKKQNDAQKRIKYVFLFIGDGMGANHAYVSDLYLKKRGLKGITFLNFPSVVLTTTNCADSNKITDSGAGGTAIATGHKTQFHAIGMDRKTGKKFTSFAEIAHRQGWKVGLISSVALNHATPACFYAHVPERSMYNLIASQMLRSGFEFFGGGGLLINGQNRDSLRKLYFDSLRQAGYKVVFNREDFDKAIKSGKKVFLTDTASLDNAQSIYYMIDSLSRVSLADFTKAAIRFLYNPKGFFLMVEGGKIDWASHANDVATMIYETADFNRAIEQALQFYQEHPDETIIIVTADHETGGLSLGYNATRYTLNLDLLSKQYRSKQFLNTYLASTYPEGYSYKLQKFVKFDTVMVDRKNFSSMVNDLVDALQHKAGISWTTHSHTAAMVPTYVKGVGADEYQGIIDNTYTFEVLMKLTGLKQ